MRKMQTMTGEEKSYSPVSPTLPIDRPCQIYPRVSTVQQVDNVSSEMQQDKSFALRCGWLEELIILDDRDLGVSGQVRMEDRRAFNEMNRRIAAGEINAVVVVQVDRLFRDRWGIEYSKFMELCERYRVRVVTPEFTYDFSISWHVDKFRRRCEDAWNYIESHIKGRLLAAQKRLAGEGYVTIGNLPMGFVIDLEKKRKKLTPNPPQAEKIQKLFEQFRECHGVTNEVMRWVVATEFLFPPFEEKYSKLRKRYRMSEVKNQDGVLLGYRPTSVMTLKHILTNPVYIGHYVSQEGVVVRDTHAAIVSEELFFYAFHILSPTTLDGDPNPHYSRRTYAKKRTSTDALASVLVSCEEGQKIYPMHTQTTKGVPYSVYQVYSGKEISTITYTVTASHVNDAVFSRLFFHLLKNTDQYEHYEDQDDGQAEHVTRLKEVARDILSLKAAIHTNQEKVLQFTQPDLLDALNTQAFALRADLKRLEEKQAEIQSQGSLQEKRRTFQELAKQLGERWREVMDEEDRNEAVELFLEKIVLTVLSPKIYSLDVHWIDYGIERITLLKETPGVFSWTAQEEEILRSVYTTSTIREMMAALPKRTYASLKTRAAELGVKRARGRGVEPTPYTFCHEDIKILEGLGVEWGSVNTRELKEEGSISFKNLSHRSSYDVVLSRMRSLLHREVWIHTGQ